MDHHPPELYARRCANLPRFTQRAAAAGRELTWAIDYSGVLAGAISLRLPGGSANAPGTHADLGFYTAPQMRGRGIMTDAVRTVLGFGFDPLGLP